MIERKFNRIQYGKHDDDDDDEKDELFIHHLDFISIETDLSTED